MSELSTRFRVNQPAVAAEDIDGEVVVVSFESGRYYSLSDTAADVWRLVSAGATLRTALERFDGDGGNGEARTAVLDFVEVLRTEGLIVEDESDPHVDSSGAVMVKPFVRPVLERFDEMSEMLLYDPIHDVDDSGWPNLPDSDVPPR